MSKRVIIRDDDTSFFTTPQMLDAVYGRLWEAGIPVSLAVVPAVRGDTRILYREDHPYDPGIPPRYRGDSMLHPITDNAELCAYLNEKITAGLVEICLHGYTHSYYEFESDDADLITQKLTDGRAILGQAFPTAQINTFIAPYDKISPIALNLLFDAGYTVCTLPKTLEPFPEYAINGGYQQFTAPNGCPLYTAAEYLFNHRDDPVTIYEISQQRLQEEPLWILVNHYWAFFYDWDQPTAVYEQWQRFLDALLALPAGTITTFAE